MKSGLLMRNFLLAMNSAVSPMRLESSCAMRAFSASGNASP